MSNVLEVVIDPDIKLDPDRIIDMPEDVKGNLLTVITIQAKKYNCDWTDLTWEVKIIAGEPIIKVKPR